MPNINPEEFGRMKEQIEQLSKTQDELARDMKAMLALANQGKGGFWAGISIAAFVSSLVTIVFKQWIN